MEDKCIVCGADVSDLSTAVNQLSIVNMIKGFIAIRFAAVLREQNIQRKSP